MKDKTAKLGKFRLDSKNATTDELLEAKKAIKFSKNNSVTIDMTNPAAGAISVGAKLQFNATTRKVDDSTTASNAYIGVAETAASAAGDLIQVKLDFNLGVAST